MFFYEERPVWDPEDELPQQLFFHLSECWRGVLSCARNMQLKPAEIAVVNILRFCDPQDQGMMASQLSRKMRVAPPTLTPMLGNLEKKGFLLRERDSNDRRVVLVRLTPQGRQALQQTIQLYRANALRMVEGMGEARARELIGLLREAASYFAAPGQPASGGRSPTPTPPQPRKDDTAQ